MAISGTPIDSGTASSSSANSLSPTLTGTATSGNILIAAAGIDAGVTAFVTPTGWTEAHKVETGAIAGAAYYKISDGTETGVTLSWGNNRSSGVIILEFSATDIDTGTAPLLAEDESNVSTVVTSQATGTTSATTVADALSIALFSADQAQNVFDGRSYSTGYIEQANVNSLTTGTRPVTYVVTNVETATGTKSCTFTTTDTGDEQYGRILVFQGSGGGGGPSVVPSSSQTINDQFSVISATGLKGAMT